MVCPEMEPASPGGGGLGSISPPWGPQGGLAVPGSEVRAVVETRHPYTYPEPSAATIPEGSTSRGGSGVREEESTMRGVSSNMGPPAPVTSLHQVQDKHPSIAQWLMEWGGDTAVMYEEAFIEEGFTTLASVATLEEADLEELGLQVPFSTQ